MSVDHLAGRPALAAVLVVVIVALVIACVCGARPALNRNVQLPRVHHRGNQLLSIVLQTVGVFVLPVVIVGAARFVVDTSEVDETAGRAASVFAMLVAPLFLLQLVGIAVRVRRHWREHRLARRAWGVGGVGAVVDVLEAAVGIVTRRGGWVLGTGLVGLVCALSSGWAEFVVFAIAVLAAWYVVVSAAAVISTFSLAATSDGAARFHRSVEPAVAVVGEPLRDIVDVDARVPTGFGLRIVAPLPARFGGESRWFVDGDARRPHTRASVPLPRTPRGVHTLPPARVVLEDLLGLTAVDVGATNTARCKVLPRLRPLPGVTPRFAPKSAPDAEPRRMPRPREEWLDLRSYVAGDDVRHIHWRQTVRAGEWIVRTPESTPEQGRRLVVLLDTFVAADVIVTEEDRAGVDGILDVAVDAWLGFARSLRDAGHDVVLLAAVATGDGVVVEELETQRVRESAWRDFGARVAPQDRLTLAAVVAERPAAIVVTPNLGGGTGGDVRVVVDENVAESFADVARHPWWHRALFFPHAAGSDENLPGAIAARLLRDQKRVADRAVLRNRVDVRRGSTDSRADAHVVVRGRGLVLVPTRPSAALRTEGGTPKTAAVGATTTNVASAGAPVRGRVA
jgi:uncharacterized protein (DUF58 family)